MNKKYTIYITDDHRIITEGIASFLIANEKYELIETFLNGNELLDNLKKKQPDILILDIKLPGLNGIQLSKIITNDYPKVKILFLSSNTDEETISKAIEAGGIGFLSKDVTEEEFILALDKITSGENYYSMGVQQTLFNSYTKNVKTIAEYHDNILTDREIEVIRLIAEGLSYKEIANNLFISVRTVETHKKNIMTKLNLKTTVDIVKFAILNGITKL